MYSSVVCTKNEQHIVFLGGYVIGSGWTDIISIYDFKINKFRQCSVKCPKKTRFEAVMVNNSENDELLTFGFVNKCFRSSQFNDIQALPYYLITLIGNWVCSEFIHIVNTDHNGGNHWKINVEAIMQ